MRRSMGSWLGALALGLAALAWAAAPGMVLARGGGGGHGGGGGGHGGGGHGGGYGGGGHGGGGHGGGGHGGGWGGGGGHGGGWGGGHHGGYYGGGGHYGRGYGGYGYGGYGGFYPSYGLGAYGWGYPGYGYGGWGYSNGYGYGDPGYYSDYNPGYYDNYSNAPHYESSQTYDQVSVNQPAHLTVNVPDNAEVYFNDIMTRQTGGVRQFVTPALEPGNYQYDIRATWMENGQRKTQTRQVGVHPGDDLNVTFSSRMAPPRP